MEPVEFVDWTQVEVKQTNLLSKANSLVTLLPRHPSTIWGEFFELKDYINKF